MKCMNFRLSIDGSTTRYYNNDIIIIAIDNDEVFLLIDEFNEIISLSFCNKLIIFRQIH